MIMNLNDVLTKQNVITKLVLENEEESLSKETKVKIMRIRLAYNKIRKNFDSDVKEFVEQITSDEFKEFQNKLDFTNEESVRYQELIDQFNSEYTEYLTQKGLEEVSCSIDDSFTEEEYFDIVNVNSGNNVEINGGKINAADFLEIFYDMFVK